MQDKYLHNGIKLLKHGDFLEATNNFEEYIIYDNSDYLGYYYLGLAYIFRELYDEAYKYITKANKLNENDLSTINTLAFLNLKFDNVDEAINYWLDILDIDKKNYIAKRNLDKVKKSKHIQKLVTSAEPDEFINFKIKKGLHLSNIMPILPKPLKNIRPLYIWISLGIITLSGLTVFIIIKKPFTYKRTPKIISKATLYKVVLPNMEADYIIDKKIEKSIFKLEPEEIQTLFYKTKNLIQNQAFNKAIININKIFHSNAGFIIKEKFKILKEFIPYQETFKLKNNIQYSTVMNLPLLYEDIQVIWKGKMEDIKLDEDELSTTFNLFVKEKSQSIGVAKVYFKKLFTNLTNGKQIEITGKFLKIDKQTRHPIIEGIGFRNSK